MAVGIEGRMAAELDRRRVWGQTDDENFNREIARTWKNSAPNPEKFIGQPYAREVVAGDMKRVGEIKKSSDYVYERRSEAVALEYVLMEGIKVHGWFGDSVTSVEKTSEYDDLMNGADFVVTFHDEDTDRFVHLAIDATTSSDEKVIFRKADKNFEKLGRGKMTEIKYFEDPDGNRGKTEMPRVILELSPERTVALQKLMVEAPDLAEDAEEKYKFIASVQKQLLKSINYVLIREGFLGEGRELQNFGEVLKFIAKHGEDLDEKTRGIVASHADVLQFIALAAPKSLH
jgi:hypothetical protein